MDIELTCTIIRVSRPLVDGRDIRAEWTLHHPCQLRQRGSV